MRSLADDLRARSDEDLGALLRARPDLARPAPSDVTALAARATTRSSIRRALESLDRAHLQALEAVVVAAPADVADVAAFLATTPGRAGELVDRLVALALCWRAPEGVRPARPVADLVGDPAGLGPDGDDGAPEGAALDEALAGLDAGQRRVLDALAWGPPVGALGVAGPEQADGQPGAVARAGAALVDAGLLERVDETHVLLPRRVALALRGGRLHRHPATEPPEVEHAGLDPAVVDAAAGGRAAELVVLMTEVLDRWGARPPRVLRTGGLAVRDLGRLADHLEISTGETAWLLESALAAGLVAADDGRGEDAAWVPTTRADDWLAAPAGARWAALAHAWWTMPAAPSLVGTGEGGRVNALSTHTSYPLARVRRQDALRTLATLPAGAAPGEEALEALLRWHQPLRSARTTAEHGVGLDVVRREAEWAGVTGRGALSSPGRALVTRTDDDRNDADVAAALMEPLVPPAVDHVLLQADLTAVAPGRLDGPVRTLMHLVSDVESRGGASVHRFSETSVQRALDLGWTADQLLAELAAASLTPVPQPLDYLVRDVARRHGRARVGSCAAYLRSDDPALLDRVEHDRALGLLQLRRIAPTVLVSPVPAATVLDVLREQQYGPVTEGPDGGLGLAAPTQRRASVRPAPPVRVSSVDETVSRQVVALLRRGDGVRASRLDETGAFSDPVVISAVLREAAASGEAVWIGYADEVGGVVTHLLRPESVEAGRVRATVGDDDGGGGDSDRVRTFLLHRVTKVRAAD